MKPSNAQEIFGEIISESPIVSGETIIGSSFPTEISVPMGEVIYTSPIAGSPVTGEVIVGETIMGHPSSIISAVPLSSTGTIGTTITNVIPSEQIASLDLKPTIRPFNKLAKDRSSENESRKTISQYWQQQKESGRPVAYPNIHFGAGTQVGDVGRGANTQRLSLVRRVREDEFLVRATDKETDRSTIFVFRRFDFASVSTGSAVPLPALCEVTGIDKYKDSKGKMRLAKVVEPLLKASLPLPDSSSVVAASFNPVAEHSAEDTSEQTDLDPAVGRIPPTEEPQPAASSPVSGSEKNQPRFLMRRWNSSDGKLIAMGRLLGVGDEVVWLKLNTGSVVRMKLSELSNADRKHALSKRRDILEYRRLKKQLKDSVQQ